MLFKHPQQQLTVKQCKALQKRTKDAFGCKWPYRGHYPGRLGSITYNGGCVRPNGFKKLKENKWYQGEEFPFPFLPDGWGWEYILSWGYHVVPEDNPNFPAKLASNSHKEKRK